MIWVKAASPKATYVLSFGAGFTPTTGLDSVSIAIPYANDGSTSLTYTIKRVEVRTETEPGASTLAFYFERHTTGNVTWASANTIKGAASANFSVAQSNYSNSFTTITSSSGNNGEVQSGNYLRVNFASVGTAVALVRLMAEGVPRLGFTNVGDVAKTNEPEPVSSEITPAS
jgi:hypothetical protein